MRPSTVEPVGLSERTEMSDSPLRHGYVRRTERRFYTLGAMRDRSLFYGPIPPFHGKPTENLNALISGRNGNSTM